jgi:hypothetical protein
MLAILTSDSTLAGHTMRLVVAGDGEDRESIERYVRDKDLHDTVISTGTGADIPDEVLEPEY